MLSNSTGAIPPGHCGIHGYHGRTACPKCSTSALPFTPLIQSPPVSAAVSPAEPPLRSGRDLAALAADFDKLIRETFWLGTELDESDEFPERAALMAMVSQANRMLNCAGLICRHPGRWSGIALYREQIAADYWKPDDA